MAAAFPVEAWLGVPEDAQQLALAPSSIAQALPPQAQRAAWAAIQAAAGARVTPGAGSPGRAPGAGPAAPPLLPSPGLGVRAGASVPPGPAREAAPATSGTTLGMVRQLSQHRFLIPISTANAAALSGLLSSCCQSLQLREGTDQWELALHCLLLLSAWARKLWAAPGPLLGTPAAGTQPTSAPRALALRAPPRAPLVTHDPAARDTRARAASGTRQDEPQEGARQAAPGRHAGSAVAAAEPASRQDGPGRGLQPAPAQLPQDQRAMSQGDRIAVQASQGALCLCSMAAAAGEAAGGVAGGAGSLDEQSTAAAAAADGGASPAAGAEPAAGGASAEAVAGAVIYCLGCFLSSRGLGSPGKGAAAEALGRSLEHLRGLWGSPSQSQADRGGDPGAQGALGGSEASLGEQLRGVHRALAGAVYAMCSPAALARDTQAGSILVRVLDLFQQSPGPSRTSLLPQGDSGTTSEETAKGLHSSPPVPGYRGHEDGLKVLHLSILQKSGVCFGQGRLVLRAMEYVGAYWHSFGEPSGGAVQPKATSIASITAVGSVTDALSQVLLAQPSPPSGSPFTAFLRSGVHVWCAAVFAAAGLLRGLCGSASRPKSKAPGSDELVAVARAGSQAGSGAPGGEGGGTRGAGPGRVATDSEASHLWSQSLGTQLGSAVARLAECLVAAAEASCPWAPPCVLPTSLPSARALLSPSTLAPFPQARAGLLKPGWLSQGQLAWLAHHFSGQDPGLCWPAVALACRGSAVALGSRGWAARTGEGAGRGSSSARAEGLAGALVCLRCAAVALSELGGGGGPGLWRVRGSEGAGRCLAAALLSDCLSLAPLRLPDAPPATQEGQRGAGEGQVRPQARPQSVPTDDPSPSPVPGPLGWATAMHAQGPWFKSAPLLTRALAEHAKAAPPCEKGWLSQALLAFATSAYQGERCALGVVRACSPRDSRGPLEWRAPASQLPCRGVAANAGTAPRSVRQVGPGQALTSPSQASISMDPSPGPISGDPSPGPSTVSALVRPKDASADTISGTAYTVICLLFTALAQESPEVVPQASGPWSGDGAAAVQQAVALDALTSLALLDFAKVGLGSLFVSLVARCSVLISSSPPAAVALLGRLPAYQDVVGDGVAHEHFSGQWLGGEGNRGPAMLERRSREGPSEAAAVPSAVAGAGAGGCVDWTQDAPTTGRVVFLFRVLLPAMPRLPVPLFCTTAGALLLLYLGHPKSEVAVQASHDLFVALLTAHSEADSVASPQSHHFLRTCLADLNVPLLPPCPGGEWGTPGTHSGAASTADAPSASGGSPDIHKGGNGERWVASVARALAWAREETDAPASKALEVVAVFYAARALQEVPGVTPVALLGRGLAAICRKLAAGSPAVQVCVNLLEERTGQLLQEASGSECRASPAFTPPATSITGSAPGAARGGRWSPSSAARPASGAGGAHGPGPTHLSTDSQCSAPPPVTELRQLLLLLLHLVSVVDIQVLPHLLRRIAARITSLSHLPDTGSLSGTQLQREALGELLQVILGTDDYTRKPALISFYQSLALVSCAKGCSKL